jgi:uncharacterized phiE125 gp8 family phage protein
MTAYLLSGPATEPVSLDDAKAYLKLDTDDEDALVTTLITAARLHVEGTTGRALITQSWRLVLDDWPPVGLVRLPVAPLQSLTAITAYDVNGDPVTLSTDGVLWDAQAAPSLLYLPAGFGDEVILRPLQGVEIDYVAGYGADASDVPATLCQALLLLVAYWFENRGAVVLAGTGSIVPSGFDQIIGAYRSIRL